MTSSLTNDERLKRRRDYAGPVFLKEGFRPLFLAAALWAALAAPLWVGVWVGLVAYGGTLDPLHWHIHEMMFGFVAAALGGFLLTAIPNWTGRLPVRGGSLAVLAALWLIGRVAMWYGEALGVWATAAADLAYLTALCLCVAVEIAAGRNWRNLPVLAGVSLLLLANVLFHAGAAGLADTGEAAVRLSIAVMTVMIALIGGRIVPSFTHNWFARHDGPAIAAPMQPFDIVTLLGTVAALAVWVFLGAGGVTGACLIVAGVLNLARLARWKGWRTAGEPLVTILHVGYFWLGAGLFLMGLSMLGTGLRESAALHVLTIGAMGTTILAVMTRAVLGHTGRALTAGPATRLIYALVTFAVLFRVAFALQESIELVWLSAGCWSAGFGLFAVVYGPMTMRSPAPASGSSPAS